VFGAVAGAGLAAAAGAAAAAWRDIGRAAPLKSLMWLGLAYCALLTGPASQIYRRVDAWQDLASIGRAIGHDAGTRPLVLMAPDETTRAFIDMYARSTVEWIAPPPTAASVTDLRQRLAAAPGDLVVAQLPGRGASPAGQRLAALWGLALSAPPPARSGTEDAPSWAGSLGLKVAHRYALPNGRRYALLEVDGVAGVR
jgi:hypothetical protein